MDTIIKFAKRHVFLILIALGVCLRLILALWLPIVNDEGSYFYDSYLILQGNIPYRDFLTKSPPHIYMLSLYTYFFGNSIFYERLSQIVLFIMNGSMLFLIAKKLFSERSAVFVFILYSLYPEVASFTTYAQTQNIQSLFLYCFIYLLISQRYSFVRLVCMGFILFAAYISRVTSVILLVMTGVYFAYSVYQKKLTTREAFAHGFTILSVFGLLLLASFVSIRHIVGFRKAFDFLGLEMFAQGTLQGSDVSPMAAVMIKLAQLGKNSIALIKMFTYVPLLFAGVVVFVTSILFRKIYGLAHIILLIAFSLMFFFTYGNLSYFYTSHVFSVSLFVESTLVLTLFGIAIYTCMYKKNTIRLYWNRSLVLLLTWITCLIGMYGLWIKFSTPYFIEFLAPSILILGYLFNAIDGEKKYLFIKKVLLITVVVAITVSQLRLIYIFHMGTFRPKDVQIIADIIKEHSSPEDTILTASLIFPYITERKVVHNLSHPYWLGYDNFDEDLLHEYMPSLQELTNEVLKKPPQIIIYNKTTYETYFELSPRLQEMLKNDYHVIYSAEYGGNIPLQVYELNNNALDDDFKE